MINWLRKVFIKDYNDLNNEEVRTKHGLLASIVGSIFNLLLFIFKIVIGFISGSISIISDAINNITDLISSIISFVCFKLSGKKPDAKHPFGYQRVEYIAGLIISFIIIMVGIIIIYTSINELIKPTIKTTYSIYAFIILGGSIFVKLFLALFYNKFSKIINSISLKANMHDSLNDCIQTSFILILAIVQYFYNDLTYLDSSISIVIALYIIFSGFKMIIEASRPLIGEPIDLELKKEIINNTLNYDGILGVHDIIIHNYGPNKHFMSMHLEVDGYEDIFKTHELIDLIEKETKEKYNIEVLIHMDPIDTKSDLLSLSREEISKALKALKLNISYHDARIVKGPNVSNLIFDIVVPYDIKVSNENLIKNIKLKYNEISSLKFNLVITIDRDC